MQEALAEARRSLDADEFPAGAIVVLSGEIVARAHWTGVTDRRLLDHSELLALMEAERSGNVVSRRQRQEATLYTTLEPCQLCMAAAMSFLLGRVVYAAPAPVDGGTNLPDLWQPPNGHPPDGKPYTIPEVAGGVCSDDSVRLIAEWIGRDPPARAWAAAYVSASPARSPES